MKQKTNKTRVNAKIIANLIRVVNTEGQQLGEMSVQEALKLAQAKELDLVEVAPNANPPVCRIMNYGKYIYQHKKKFKTNTTKKTILKQMNFRPNTGEEDVKVKVNKIIKFLADGNKVKIVVRFSGREIQHKNVGSNLLKNIIILLDDLAIVEQQAKMEGYFMAMIVIPNKITKK